MVKILDMANIVTGYFQDGRDSAMFMLMRSIQTALRELKGTTVTDDRPRKRFKVTNNRSSAIVTSDTVLVPGVKEIKRYTFDDAPGFEQLAECTEPFIVTGGVSHWPAIAQAETRWADSQYLLRVAGEGRIVPVEIGSSYTAEGWTQKMMDFTEFLDKIGWNRLQLGESKAASATSTEEPTLYLAQHDLFQQLPDLLQDVIKPDYVFASLEAPVYFPEYRPPASGYTLNAWLGPAGTYSPAHTDPYYNCYGRCARLT